MVSLIGKLNIFLNHLFSLEKMGSWFLIQFNSSVIKRFHSCPSFFVSPFPLSGVEIREQARRAAGQRRGNGQPVNLAGRRIPRGKSPQSPRKVYSKSTQTFIGGAPEVSKSAAERPYTPTPGTDSFQ